VSGLTASLTALANDRAEAAGIIFASFATPRSALHPTIAGEHPQISAVSESEKRTATGLGLQSGVLAFPEPVDPLCSDHLSSTTHTPATMERRREDCRLHECERILLVGELGPRCWAG